MNYSVILVQKGIFNPTHAVSGISGKLYGHAVASPAHGGVVFAMGMEDYVAGMYDIVGNKQPNQQWVPEFVAAPPKAEGEPETHGFCSIPGRCNLGPDGTKRDACYVWDHYLFCEFHAPNNATPLFAGAPPIQPPPAAEPVTEPTPPPASAPAAEAPPHVSIAPAPEVPPKAPPGPAADPGPPATTPEPQAKQPTVRELIEQVVNDKMDAAMTEIRLLLKPAAKPANKKAVPAKSDLQVLRDKARTLGINTFQMSKEAIQAAITAKEAAPPPDVP